ncbi:hypothetical protein I7I48_02892 [Histoplasma ohiense]|nr:hypothetical protein I7I48_02892 [Histoplasma ohiense (nom. inval.)]
MTPQRSYCSDPPSFKLSIYDLNSLGLGLTLRIAFPIQQFHFGVRFGGLRKKCSPPRNKEGIGSRFVFVVLFGNSIVALSSVFLKLPVSVVQRAYLSSSQPSGDAVEVECMVTNPPSNCAFLRRGRALVCLAFDT